MGSATPHSLRLSVQLINEKGVVSSASKKHDTAENTGSSSRPHLGDVVELDVRLSRLAQLGDVGLCRRLTVLVLRDNYIADVRPLFGCISLVWLDLGNNDVSTVPDQFMWSSLHCLRLLNLDGNSIAAFPALQSLAACPLLEVLTLSDTPLSLKPHYRHCAVNLIQTLRALDGYIVADEEVIEDLWNNTRRFAARTKSFKVPCVPPAGTLRSFHNTMLRVSRRHAHQSPTLIIQRWWRGTIVRRFVRQDTLVTNIAIAVATPQDLLEDDGDVPAAPYSTLDADLQLGGGLRRAVTPDESQNRERSCTPEDGLRRAVTPLPVARVSWRVHREMEQFNATFVRNKNQAMTNDYAKDISGLLALQLPRQKKIIRETITVPFRLIAMKPVVESAEQNWKEKLHAENKVHAEWVKQADEEWHTAKHKEEPPMVAPDPEPTHKARFLMKAQLNADLACLYSVSDAYREKTLRDLSARKKIAVTDERNDMLAGVEMGRRRLAARKNLAKRVHLDHLAEVRRAVSATRLQKSEVANDYMKRAAAGELSRQAARQRYAGANDFVSQCCSIANAAKKFEGITIRDWRSNATYEETQNQRYNELTAKADVRAYIKKRAKIASKVATVERNHLDELVRYQDNMDTNRVLKRVQRLKDFKRLRRPPNLPGARCIGDDVVVQKPTLPKEDLMQESRRHWDNVVEGVSGRIGLYNVQLSA